MTKTLEAVLNLSNPLRTQLHRIGSNYSSEYIVSADCRTVDHFMDGGEQLTWMRWFFLKNRETSKRDLVLEIACQASNSVQGAPAARDRHTRELAYLLTFDEGREWNKISAEPDKLELYAMSKVYENLYRTFGVLQPTESLQGIRAGHYPIQIHNMFEREYTRISRREIPDMVACLIDYVPLLIDSQTQKILYGEDGRRKT